MTVVSKYLDEAIVRYEKMGFSKQALSKGIVTVAIGAYVAHISYPYLSKMIKAANLAPVLSETASTSDDDTSDSDFDSESDDYESAIETNNINSNGIDRKNNDTNRKLIEIQIIFVFVFRKFKSKFREKRKHTFLQIFFFFCWCIWYSFINNLVQVSFDDGKILLNFA